jgi:hypothetical protein
MAKASRFTNGIVIRNGRPNAAGSSSGETKISSIRAYSVAVDLASVGANTTAEQDVTVTGLLAGDIVLCVNKPTGSAGAGIVNARVKAADVLAVTLVNATAGAIDVASETWWVVVMTATAHA